MLDPKVFLRLLQLDLRAHPPSAPVVKIRLQAEPTRPRRSQNGLFLPAAPEPEKLEVLLARLAAVVENPRPDSTSGNSKLETRNSSGNCELRTENVLLETGNLKLETTRVGSPELLDSHRPDAFRMRRFSPPDPSKPETGNWKLETGNSSENSKLETGNSKLFSALRLFRPPLRVTMEMREERPLRLACARKPALRGDVIWAAGPWRSSGNWWQEAISDSRLENCRLREGGSPSGLTQPNIQSSIFNFQSSPNLQSPAWDREEWDIAVRNEAGLALYRLVRDLAAQIWFLEGSYD